MACLGPISRCGATLILAWLPAPPRRIAHVAAAISLREPLINWLQRQCHRPQFSFASSRGRWPSQITQGVRDVFLSPAPVSSMVGDPADCLLKAADAGLLDQRLVLVSPERQPLSACDFQESEPSPRIARIAIGDAPCPPATTAREALGLFSGLPGSRSLIPSGVSAGLLPLLWPLQRRCRSCFMPVRRVSGFRLAGWVDTAGSEASAPPIPLMPERSSAGQPGNLRLPGAYLASLSKAAATRGVPSAGPDPLCAGLKPDAVRSRPADLYPPLALLRTATLAGSAVGPLGCWGRWPRFCAAACDLVLAGAVGVAAHGAWGSLLHCWEARGDRMLLESLGGFARVQLAPPRCSLCRGELPR